MTPSPLPVVPRRLAGPGAPGAPDAERRLAAAFGAPTALEGLQTLRIRLGAPRALRDDGFDPSTIGDAVAAILLRQAWEGADPG